MSWFKKEKYTTLTPPSRRDRIPEGLWTRCENCVEMILTRDFEENLRVCAKCGHHHRFGARDRVKLLTDEDSFQEMYNNIQPVDALKFVDSKEYSTRLKKAKETSGYDEAVVTGVGQLFGHKIALAVMAFDFIGGSMGSVVGERITNLIEHACDNRLPVIIVTSSGGARMQEGILSLMQMAKTSGALARLAAKKIPFISILANPSTGGVMASYASLGDVNIAEPDALIGFAGQRVIENTIKQILPKGFQKSDFVLEHGFLDLVVTRAEMKNTLAMLLYYMTGQRPLCEMKNEKSNYSEDSHSRFTPAKPESTGTPGDTQISAASA